MKPKRDNHHNLDYGKLHETNDPVVPTNCMGENPIL